MESLEFEDIYKCFILDQLFKVWFFFYEILKNYVMKFYVIMIIFLKYKENKNRQRYQNFYDEKKN